jgi:hypothetical protein
MQNTPRFSALVLSLSVSLVSGLALGGCENAVDVSPAGDVAAVYVAEGDDLLDNMGVDDSGFQISHVIAAHGAFSRVGLRYDADGPVAIDVRVSSDGGATFGPWAPGRVTFEEAGAHNAFVDVATADATHLQLRFVAPVESQLTFLIVDAFDQAAEADVAVAGVASTSEQGLSGGLVQPRSAWGARSRNCSGAHSPSKVTIHHTETPNNDSMSIEARLRQIQSYHIDVRGWCDIGYHFLVGRDGRVFQGRPETQIGAHVSGANTNNVGISFVGSFQTTAPPAAMLTAASTVMAALSTQYGIRLSASTVKGHRDQGSTDCPGDLLYARISSLISTANAPSTPEPEPEPEPTEPGACIRAEVIDAETLNVRPQANTSRAPVGTVSAGDVVDVVNVVEGQAVSGVTRWFQIRDGSLQGFISGRYARCTATSQPTEPTEPTEPTSIYGGLDRGTAQIPRAGLANDTLRGALGVATEPYGSLFQYQGEDYVRGRVSHFGGPSDTGVTSTETGAITGERLRSLNSPENASRATINSRPQDFYYIAMRWDYTPHGRAFWQSARILVVNPANGVQVVLRPVDWGPNTNTARILDISPQALRDLGASTDANLLVAFAAADAPLGIVE